MNFLTFFFVLPGTVTLSLTSELNCVPIRHSQTFTCKKKLWPVQVNWLEKLVFLTEYSVWYIRPNSTFTEFVCLNFSYRTLPCMVRLFKISQMIDVRLKCVTLRVYLENHAKQYFDYILQALSRLLLICLLRCLQSNPLSKVYAKEQIKLLDLSLICSFWFSNFLRV